ncbi:MAG: GNAT family N-acetyltransferase [Spirochaetales bacterium]|nr:GNAT family N-acetyltransferase [Spirochaetales bacterium]
MVSIDYIDPAKDPKWDDFVLNHRLGKLCHLSVWQKLLLTQFRHCEGRYIVLRDGESIVAGLPVYIVRSPLLGTRLVHVPFSTLCDPLVSSEEQLHRLLEEVLRLFKRIKPKSLEIRTLDSYVFFKNQPFTENDFYYFHYLPLDRPVDEIWKDDIHYNMRRYINKAKTYGLRFGVIGEEKDIGKFYRLYLKTKKKLGLPPLPLEFIKALWKKLYGKNMIDIYLAYDQKKPVAGMLVFKYKESVSMEIACSDPESLGMYPNYFIYWEAIMKAHGEGYSVFDFGRTSPLNKGLVTFKKRFGGKERNFHYFYIFPNAIEIKEKDETKSYRLISSMLKLLPLPMVKYFGRFYYGHSS